MIFKPKPDRLIDPLTRSVIREVKSAVTDLGLDVFLVGATARIILLENVFMPLYHFQFDRSMRQAGVEQA